MNSAALVTLAIAALVVMSAQAAPTDLLEEIESEIQELRGVLQERQEPCCDITPDVCNYNRLKCDDSAIKSYMARNCKKTCGLCGAGSGCKDKDESCSQWSSYCGEQDTADLCPKTCGKC